MVTKNLVYFDTQHRTILSPNKCSSYVAGATVGAKAVSPMGPQRELGFNA